MSTVCCEILAGNAVTIQATFTPDSGAVALADVTILLRDPAGVETDLSPVVEVAANQFKFVHPIADDARRGTYWVRVESDSPSPQIAVEGSFKVRGSKFATP